MRDVGIRVALGAPTGGVLRLIVIEGLKPTLIGVAIGLALAAALARAMTTLWRRSARSADLHARSRAHRVASLSTLDAEAGALLWQTCGRCGAYFRPRRWRLRYRPLRDSPSNFAAWSLLPLAALSARSMAARSS
jgi:hypothetical protein